MVTQRKVKMQNWIKGGWVYVVCVVQIFWFIFGNQISHLWGFLFVGWWVDLGMNNVKIIYCNQWFSDEASRLEEELNTNFEEIVIKLEEGKTGQFTVFLNDKKIYNKMKWIGRLPKKMEITEIINNTSR